MKTNVKDLSVSELQTLISDTVKTAMEVNRRYAGTFQ
jgi:hypothetical protein